MIASIEAPFALLEKPIKAFLVDTIESSQMALGPVPEIPGTVDMIGTFHEGL